MNSSFIKFIIVGAIAAVINILARYVINLFLNYNISIVLAFPIALTVAFILNKIYVFEKSSLSLQDSYIRFTIINLVSLLQVWLVSIGLYYYIFPYINFTFYSDTIAHAIGVVSPIVTSYLLHKKYSFGERK